MKSIQVIAAVIVLNEKILCVQRGAHKYPYISNKWEFPGGKMENGESQEETIIREVREELSMEIIPHEHLLSHTHHYPDFSLTIYFWRCTPISKSLQLNEHQAYVWLKASELIELDWAEADVKMVEMFNKIKIC